MPRRKIYRTPEEEEEFKRIRRERNAENQQRRRSIAAENARLNNVVSGISTQCTVSATPTGHEAIVENITQNSNITILHIVSGIELRHLIDIEPRIAENDQTNNRLFNYQHQQDCQARQRGYVDAIHVENMQDVIEQYIGKMDVTCIHCNAMHFSAEKVANKGFSFNDCCHHGTVILDVMPNPPAELRSFFEGTHSMSKDFYQKIRSYNSAFSFASFNANLVNFNSGRRAPYCFKIHGQIYYQINTSLYPTPTERASYGQLFIVDQNEAVDCRMNYNSDLDTQILRTLDTLFREYNAFAQSYQMMSEELEAQRIRSHETNETLPEELQLLFTLKPGMDRRRYNFQRTNEVAAVFSTTADGEIPESYVTIRNRNTKTLQSISSMDPNVEPWIYPLFYPYGTQGWHRDLKTTNDKRVTRAAYVKYRMALRNNENEFNSILLGRRLFQQWVVDNYVKIEKDRIEFIKTNQRQLRAETYHGLVDYLQNAANNANARVGKMVILPSTFVGSPRNMMQHYQDAMGIVRKYGKPDLFITMTCNPQWLEIKENIFPQQQASDRPDICTRVFNIKKDCLVDMIVRQKLFGEVIAYVYVIEFQKRGLPHMHMLVTLKQDSKITVPEVVDRYISAEIPYPSENPVLHEIVMKHMIHGPCGSWCEVNGKCSKHYPKQFREQTTMDEDGYPYYRRRNTNTTYERPGGYVVDNRHVVPYCPVLSMIYNSHINVEVVSSIRSVKYLYKYVYKGHDAAAVTIGEASDDNVINHDEVQNYIEARYVGPVEACWRILSKPLQHKSHAIVRLPVHLRNEQSITIRNDDMNEDAVRSALDRVTMLIDYFALNVRDENARQYVYPEIPCHYVFKSKQVDGRNVHQWEKRQAHFNIIGRMYSVRPSQTELFHLRLLLLTVKGATSFENLRTVNGQVHEGFAATCLALGLIEDDDEWRRAMQEAATWMMPRRLRRMFVRILIHCQPVHPEELWEEFKVTMSEDYARSVGMVQGQRTAYARIAAMLLAEGWNLSQFPTMEQTSEIIESDDIILPDQSLQIGARQYEKLNDSQKNVVDTVLNAVDVGNGHERDQTCIYIDGPGGSGKTFVYSTLWHLLNSRNKSVSSMAFTGIAATLLPHGKTVHKTFGLPVPLFADSSSGIKVQSKDGKYLEKVDAFIWDEAPMAPRYALEVVDRTLRDIMNNDIPFGGKIVVLGGDFRQLLPIKVHGTRSEVVNLSIKNSTLWRHFSQFTLTQNMRALPEQADFAKFLLDVGSGALNDSEDNLLLPERCVASADSNIVNDLYGEYIKKKQYKEAAKCAILSARNADVDEINKRVVELLDHMSERLYTSVDNAEHFDTNDEINEALLPEYLNSLSPSSLPPHELRLRKYTIVMLIRNLSINEGLCNGTRLLVLDLANNMLRCEILTGDKAGEIVYLNRITLHCENVYPFSFKRRQFPVKLAFAMTINKAQGQTFEKIGIDLRKDVFNHGQLYVAFSRVRSWDSLKVYLGNQRNRNSVKNHVYKEMFV